MAVRNTAAAMSDRPAQRKGLFHMRQGLAAIIAAMSVFSSVAQAAGGGGAGGGGGGCFAFGHQSGQPHPRFSQADGTQSGDPVTWLGQLLGGSRNHNASVAPTQSGARASSGN